VHCAVEEFTFLYLDYLVVIVFFVVLDLLFLFSFFFIDTFIRFNRNVNENLYIVDKIFIPVTLPYC
jgi:hypothetical protein